MIQLQTEAETLPTEDAGAAWDRHMRRGDWEAAWRVADAVMRSRPDRHDPRLPRHEQAIWDGRPLAGKRVLVRCYHGLGDTIQFIRYMPLLRRVAASVVTWAQPALIPLLATTPELGPLLPLHDGTPEVAYDADIEVMELLHMFRSTPRTLPAGIPYLHPPCAGRFCPPGMLGVGLVWQAGDWDPRRSIPTGLLCRLAGIPGVALHALQRGPALASLPAGLAQDSGTDSVLEAARRMTGFDLIISVDSMPAHLAGALGLPVWTLLAHRADWRWMEGREDSPWYPTMRLLRQPSPGDWTSVIDRVAADLAAMASRR